MCVGGGDRCVCVSEGVLHMFWGKLNCSST